MALACPLAPSPLRFRNMRIRSVVLVSLSVLLLGLTAPARAAAPPSEFGSDYDDPRTPAPPISVPHTKHCQVEIVRNQFRNFDLYQSTYTPPAACQGPWSKVVLRMHGAVKGVQYDRLGHITIGGVGRFPNPTPQPTPDGTPPRAGDGRHRLGRRGGRHLVHPVAPYAATGGDGARQRRQRHLHRRPRYHS